MESEEGPSSMMYHYHEFLFILSSPDFKWCYFKQTGRLTTDLTGTLLCFFVHRPNKRSRTCVRKKPSAVQKRETLPHPVHVAVITSPLSPFTNFKDYSTSALHNHNLA